MDILVGKMSCRVFQKRRKWLKNTAALSRNTLKVSGDQENESEDPGVA